MRHIQRILVPMDGSSASVAALSQAVALADDLGAAIDVLHVTAPDQFVVGSTTDTASSAHAEADRDLEQAVVAAESLLRERLSRRALSGEPVRTILEIATTENVDLIVMGTHGRIGRLHALVGSVAESIVRNSPCPVMTVRQPDGEEESYAERIHGREPIADQARSSR
jgi:nucleotide-binding universal stress UspA family protein